MKRVAVAALCLGAILVLPPMLTQAERDYSNIEIKTSDAQARLAFEDHIAEHRYSESLSLRLLFHPRKSRPLG
jgi:hypothetical protein